MDNFWNYVLIYGPVVVNFIILVWWRYCCTSEFKYKFPTKGHILLFALLSFIPILGIIIMCILVAFYIGLRAVEDLHLKPNKFNKFWFDIEEDE